MYPWEELSVKKVVETRVKALRAQAALDHATARLPSVYWRSADPADRDALEARAGSMEQAAQQLEDELARFLEGAAFEGLRS